MPLRAFTRRAGRSGEFVRFLLAGLVNTAVGYGAYLLMLSALGYDLAYAAAFAIGILVAYVLNSKFVFRAPIEMRRAVFYPLVYVIQYLFGAFILRAVIVLFGVDQRWAALAALLASVPVSFFLNRLALRGHRPRNN